MTAQALNIFLIGLNMTIKLLQDVTLPFSTKEVKKDDVVEVVEKVGEWLIAEGKAVAV